MSAFSQTQTSSFVPSPAATRAAQLTARVARAVLVIPALATCVALVQLVFGAVSAFEVALLAGMYTLTLLGVETGFHRLVAHRGLSTTPAGLLLLGVAGSMAAEGPIGWWVAFHRRHHERSDEDGDPHSPHLTRGRVSGLLHAHLGWMWTPPSVELMRYARDVLRNPTLWFVHRTYALWVLLGLIVPAVLGAAWFGTPSGAARGLLWGGLVRIFLVHNAMWCVASVCHLWGSRPYLSKASDQSRNNAWLALPTFGESWHNNHHAFPSSARHGLEWWQLDINYLFIRVLAALGIARDVRVPSAEMKRAKRRRAEAIHA